MPTSQELDILLNEFRPKVVQGNTLLHVLCQSVRPNHYPLELLEYTLHKLASQWIESLEIDNDDTEQPQDNKDTSPRIIQSQLTPQTPYSTVNPQISLPPPPLEQFTPITKPVVPSFEKQRQQLFRNTQHDDNTPLSPQEIRDKRKQFNIDQYIAYSQFDNDHHLYTNMYIAQQTLQAKTLGGIYFQKYFRWLNKDGMTPLDLLLLNNSLTKDVDRMPLVQLLTSSMINCPIITHYSILYSIKKFNLSQIPLYTNPGSSEAQDIFKKTNSPAFQMGYLQEPTQSHNFRTFNTIELLIIQAKNIRDSYGILDILFHHGGISTEINPITRQSLLDLLIYHHNLLQSPVLDLIFGHLLSAREVPLTEFTLPRLLRTITTEHVPVIVHKLLTPQTLTNTNNNQTPPSPQNSFIQQQKEHFSAIKNYLKSQEIKQYLKYEYYMIVLTSIFISNAKKLILIQTFHKYYSIDYVSLQQQHTEYLTNIKVQKGLKSQQVDDLTMIDKETNSLINLVDLYIQHPILDPNDPFANRNNALNIDEAGNNNVDESDRISIEIVKYLCEECNYPITPTIIENLVYYRQFETGVIDVAVYFIDIAKKQSSLAKSHKKSQNYYNFYYKLLNTLITTYFQIYIQTPPMSYYAKMYSEYRPIIEPFIDLLNPNEYYRDIDMSLSWLTVVQGAPEITFNANKVQGGAELPRPEKRGIIDTFWWLARGGKDAELDDDNSQNFKIDRIKVPGNVNMTLFSRFGGYNIPFLHTFILFIENRLKFMSKCKYRLLLISDIQESTLKRFEAGTGHTGEWVGDDEEVFDADNISLDQQIQSQLTHVQEEKRLNLLTNQNKQYYYLSKLSQYDLCTKTLHILHLSMLNILFTTTKTKLSFIKNIKTEVLSHYNLINVANQLQVQNNDQPPAPPIALQDAIPILGDDMIIDDNTSAIISTDQLSHLDLLLDRRNKFIKRFPQPNVSLSQVNAIMLSKYPDVLIPADISLLNLYDNAKLYLEINRFHLFEHYVNYYYTQLIPYDIEYPSVINPESFFMWQEPQDIIMKCVTFVLSYTIMHAGMVRGANGSNNDSNSFTNHSLKYEGYRDVDQDMIDQMRYPQNIPHNLIVKTFEKFICETSLLNGYHTRNISIFIQWMVGYFQVPISSHLFCKLLTTNKIKYELLIDPFLQDTTMILYRSHHPENPWLWRPNHNVFINFDNIRDIHAEIIETLINHYISDTLVPVEQYDANYNLEKFYAKNNIDSTKIPENLGNYLLYSNENQLLEDNSRDDLDLPENLAKRAEIQLKIGKINNLPDIHDYFTQNPFVYDILHGQEHLDLLAFQLHCDHLAELPLYDPLTQDIPSRPTNESNSNRVQSPKRTIKNDEIILIKPKGLDMANFTSQYYENDLPNWLLEHYNESIQSTLFKHQTGYYMQVNENESEAEETLESLGPVSEPEPEPEPKPEPIPTQEEDDTEAPPEVMVEEVAKIPKMKKLVVKKMHQATDTFSAELPPALQRQHTIQKHDAILDFLLAGNLKKVQDGKQIEKDTEKAPEPSEPSKTPSPKVTLASTNVNIFLDSPEELIRTPLPGTAPSSPAVVPTITTNMTSLEEEPQLRPIIIEPQHTFQQKNFAQQSPEEEENPFLSPTEEKNPFLTPLAEENPLFSPSTEENPFLTPLAEENPFFSPQELNPLKDDYNLSTPLSVNIPKDRQTTFHPAIQPISFAGLAFSSPSDAENPFKDLPPAPGVLRKNKQLNPPPMFVTQIQDEEGSDSELTTTTGIQFEGVDDVHGQKEAQLYNIDETPQIDQDITKTRQALTQQPADLENDQPALDYTDHDAILDSFGDDSAYFHPISGEARRRHVNKLLEAEKIDEYEPLFTQIDIIEVVDGKGKKSLIKQTPDLHKKFKQTAHKTLVYATQGLQIAEKGAEIATSGLIKAQDGLVKLHSFIQNAEGIDDYVEAAKDHAQNRFDSAIGAFFQWLETSEDDELLQNTTKRVQSTATDPNQLSLSETDPYAPTDSSDDQHHLDNTYSELEDHLGIGKYRKTDKYTPDNTNNNESDYISQVPGFLYQSLVDIGHAYHSGTNYLAKGYNSTVSVASAIWHHTNPLFYFDIAAYFLLYQINARKEDYGDFPENEKDEWFLQWLSDTIGLTKRVTIAKENCMNPIGVNSLDKGSYDCDSKNDADDSPNSRHHVLQRKLFGGINGEDFLRIEVGPPDVIAQSVGQPNIAANPHFISPTGEIKTLSISEAYKLQLIKRINEEDYTPTDQDFKYLKRLIRQELDHMEEIPNLDEDSGDDPHGDGSGGTFSAIWRVFRHLTSLQLTKWLIYAGIAYYGWTKLEHIGKILEKDQWLGERYGEIFHFGFSFGTDPKKLTRKRWKLPPEQYKRYKEMGIAVDVLEANMNDIPSSDDIDENLPSPTTPLDQLYAKIPYARIFGDNSPNSANSSESDEPTEKPDLSRYNHSETDIDVLATEFIAGKKAWPWNTLSGAVLPHSHKKPPIIDLTKPQKLYDWDDNYTPDEEQTGSPTEVDVLPEYRKYFTQADLKKLKNDRTGLAATLLGPLGWKPDQNTTTDGESESSNSDSEKLGKRLRRRIMYDERGIPWYVDEPEEVIVPTSKNKPAIIHKTNPVDAFWANYILPDFTSSMVIEWQNALKRAGLSRGQVFYNALQQSRPRPFDVTLGNTDLSRFLADKYLDYKAVSERLVNDYGYSQEMAIRILSNYIEPITLTMRKLLPARDFAEWEIRYRDIGSEWLNLMKSDAVGPPHINWMDELFRHPSHRLYSAQFPSEELKFEMERTKEKLEKDFGIDCNTLEKVPLTPYQGMILSRDLGLVQGMDWIGLNDVIAQIHARNFLKHLKGIEAEKNRPPPRSFLQSFTDYIGFTKQPPYNPDTDVTDDEVKEYLSSDACETSMVKLVQKLYPSSLRTEVDENGKMQLSSPSMLDYMSGMEGCTPFYTALLQSTLPGSMAHGHHSPDPKMAQLAQYLFRENELRKKIAFQKQYDLTAVYANDWANRVGLKSANQSDKIRLFSIFAARAMALDTIKDGYESKACQRDIYNFIQLNKPVSALLDRFDKGVYHTDIHEINDDVFTEMLLENYTDDTEAGSIIKQVDLIPRQMKNNKDTNATKRIRKKRFERIERKKIYDHERLAKKAENEARAERGEPEEEEELTVRERIERRKNREDFYAKLNDDVEDEEDDGISEDDYMKEEEMDAETLRRRKKFREREELRQNYKSPLRPDTSGSDADVEDDYLGIHVVKRQQALDLLKEQARIEAVYGPELGRGTRFDDLRREVEKNALLLSNGMVPDRGYWRSYLDYDEHFREAGEDRNQINLEKTFFHKKPYRLPEIPDEVHEAVGAITKEDELLYDTRPPHRRQSIIDLRPPTAKEKWEIDFTKLTPELIDDYSLLISDFRNKLRDQIRKDGHPVGPLWLMSDDIWESARTTYTPKEDAAFYALYRADKKYWDTLEWRFELFKRAAATAINEANETKQIKRGIQYNTEHGKHHNFDRVTGIYDFP